MRHFAPTLVALAVSYAYAIDLLDPWPAVYLAGSCAIIAGALWLGRVAGEREARDQIDEMWKDP